MHLLEGSDGWDQRAHHAYDFFEKEGNRPIMIEELASVRFIDFTRCNRVYSSMTKSIDFLGAGSESVGARARGATRLDKTFGREAELPRVRQTGSRNVVSCEGLAMALGFYSIGADLHPRLAGDATAVL